MKHQQIPRADFQDYIYVLQSTKGFRGRRTSKQLEKQSHGICILYKVVV